MGKMNELQEQLNNCIAWFGPNDILTIMVSQRLDKHIEKMQRERVKS